MKRTSIAWLFLTLIACVSTPVSAANAVDVLKVDLGPLIEKSAPYQNRFAVDVPHAASTATRGQWESVGATQKWTYSVQIPTAVSLSFHASRFSLPAGAVLSVTGNVDGATASYRAEDVNRGGLWGRPLRGDTLHFTLTVDAAQSGAVQFEIASLQAGYRSLDHSVPDHPQFRIQSVDQPTQPACVQNYACNISPGNAGPARATVALLIGNVGQCTGTLVNNVREDEKPYILTARHCEKGLRGGGDPSAAASITVYWNAVSPCGQVLGSLYNGATDVQSGALTMVEQQDAWLIRLDRKPALANASFAGWDATGATFTGGYAIHHALGLNQQYARWFGQAVLEHFGKSTLDVGYDSDLWGLVNDVGTIGAGASGGGLFDPANRLVGNSSLAFLNDGDWAACPAPAPAAPSHTTEVALYTAFGSIWNSTSDATSTTGSATLRSVLDPDGTGTQVLNGYKIIPVTLNSSASALQSGSLITLTWNAPDAQNCTASGGAAGDGWAGTLAASGSLQLTEESNDSLSYNIVCSGIGKRGSAATTVRWIYTALRVELFNSSVNTLVIGNSTFLNWSVIGNPETTQCTGTGGTPGDGWAGSKASISGSQSVPLQAVGLVTYGLSCTAGSHVTSAQVAVDVVAPTVSIAPDYNNLAAGQYVRLKGIGGGQCTASGGSPTGHWSGSTFNWYQATPIELLVFESQPGTYTYGLTCTGGGLTAHATATVTFVNAPHLTLTADPAAQEISNVTGPNLSWSGNTRDCTLYVTGPGKQRWQVLFDPKPAGSVTVAEEVAGHYTYQLECAVQAAVATLDWFTHQPQVTIDPVPATLTGGVANQVSWHTNVNPCTASGGGPSDGWPFASVEGGSHVSPFAETAPGTYTYTITCGTGAQVASAHFTATLPPAAVTITASTPEQFIGRRVTLTWSATTSPCDVTSSGGFVPNATIIAGAGATGLFSLSEGSAATVTYTVSCGSGTQTAQASVAVTYSLAPAPVLTLTPSVTTAAVNTPVTLDWNALNVSSCLTVGGLGNDGWSGAIALSGTKTVTSLVPISITYGLVCDAASKTVTVNYSAPPPSATDSLPPAVTLSASAATVTAGRTVTLSWDAHNANSCSASGGVSGDGWMGTLAFSGSTGVTEANAGAVTYTITCIGAPPAATASTTVTFAAAPGTVSNNGSGNSGGGGGGAFTPLWLALLSLLALRPRRRAHDIVRHLRSRAVYA